MKKKKTKSLNRGAAMEPNVITIKASTATRRRRRRRSGKE
jgi:hypothetical protein